jgi:hypothetical protein
VRTCTGETLKALAESANSPTGSEDHKERARARLERRLAQFNALQADPKLPAAIRVEVDNALRSFGSLTIGRVAIPSLLCSGLTPSPSDAERRVLCVP